MDVQTSIQLYVDMIEYVIPFVAVWCFCNVIVKSIINAGFRGDAQI